MAENITIPLTQNIAGARPGEVAAQPGLAWFLEQRLIDPAETARGQPMPGLTPW